MPLAISKCQLFNAFSQQYAYLLGGGLCHLIICGGYIMGKGLGQIIGGACPLNMCDGSGKSWNKCRFVWSKHLMNYSVISINSLICVYQYREISSISVMYYFC